MPDESFSICIDRTCRVGKYFFYFLDTLFKMSEPAFNGMHSGIQTVHSVIKAIHPVTESVHFGIEAVHPGIKSIYTPLQFPEICFRSCFCKTASDHCREIIYLRIDALFHMKILAQAPCARERGHMIKY